MEPLIRTLESSNPEKVKKIQKKLNESLDFAGIFTITAEFSFFCIVIPNFDSWHDEFRVMIERALVDSDMKNDLEQQKIINWCRVTCRLYPLNTLRDGNCLLHAVSTFMWGVQDTELSLRRLLHATMLNDPDGIFKHRYIMYRKNAEWNQLLQLSDDTSLNNEWHQIQNNAQPKENANFANPHSFLEPIHVFVLANILRRPIIVMAGDKIRSMTDETTMQVSDMGGIYLPLQFPATDCCKSPIVLGFTLSHFSPLVTCKDGLTSGQKLALTLQMKDMSQLPLKFLNADEEKKGLNLTYEFLNIVDLPYSSNGTYSAISGAKLTIKNMPENLQLVDDFVRDCERKYRGFLNDEANPHGNEMPGNEVTPMFQVPGNQRQEFETRVEQPPYNHQRHYGIRGENPSPETMHFFQNKMCITVGCKMFGTAATGHMCSSCLKQYTETNTGPPRRQDIVQPSEINGASAPPPTMPTPHSFQHESLMGQKCQTQNCQFMCSTETQPFCHVCHEKGLLRQQSNASSNTEEKRRLSAEMEIPILNPSFPRSNLTSSSSSEMYGLGSNTQLQFEATNTQHIKQCTQPESESGQHGLFFGSTNRRSSADEQPSTGAVGSGTPPLSSNQACRTTGCKRQISGNHGGICTLCYVTCCSPSQRQPGPDLHQQQPNIPGSPVKMSKNNSEGMKSFCSTPGCEGVRCKNEHGMCYPCLQKNSQGASNPRELPRSEEKAMGFQETTTTTGSMEVNLVESRSPSDTGSRSSEPQYTCMDECEVECASPMCENRVTPPEKLCMSCLNILRESLARKSNTTGNCKMGNCTFHGADKYNGYCSDCYKTVMRKGHSAPVPRKNQHQVEQFLVEKSNTSPVMPSRRGTKCIVDKCTRYGDPSTRNMCSRCSQMGAPLSAPILSTPVTPQHASVCLPNPPESNRYQECFKQVENSRKVNHLCKTRDCKNFGNPNSDGFCNDCYTKYRKTFGRKPTGRFGEEMIG